MLHLYILFFYNFFINLLQSRGTTCTVSTLTLCLGIHTRAMWFTALLNVYSVQIPSFPFALRKRPRPSVNLWAGVRMLSPHAQIRGLNSHMIVIWLEKSLYAATSDSEYFGPALALPPGDQEVRPSVAYSELMNFTSQRLGRLYRSVVSSQAPFRVVPLEQGLAGKFGIGPQKNLTLDGGPEHSQRIISGLLERWCENFSFLPHPHNKLITWLSALL